VAAISPGVMYCSRRSFGLSKPGRESRRLARSFLPTTR